MLKNITGKRVHIKWKEEFLHVEDGETVDLPNNYAHRYGFVVVGTPTPAPKKKAGKKPKKKKVFESSDVNKDGKTDFKDVLEVVKKAVRKKKKVKKK